MRVSNGREECLELQLGVDRGRIRDDVREVREESDRGVIIIQG